MKNLLSIKNLPITITALYGLSRGTTLISSTYGPNTNWFYLGFSIVGVILGVLIIIFTLTDNISHITKYLALTYLGFSIVYTVYGIISFQLFSDLAPLGIKIGMPISSVIAIIIRLLLAYHIYIQFRETEVNTDYESN